MHRACVATRRMPRGAGPAALAGRLPLPLLRPSRALRAGGARALPMQPVQEYLPRDQAAAHSAAIHLIVTASGISSVELGRRLGVKQPTAWAVKHKIMAVLTLEMDESRRGALRRQARGAAGKTPFVAAVSTSRGARQAEAGAGGLPQARDRAWRQALAGPRRGGCDGRLGLLERTRRDRLQPSGNPHRVGPTGAPHGIVQMGQYDARQHQVPITGTYRKLGPDHAGRSSPVSPGATTAVINSRR